MRKSRKNLISGCIALALTMSLPTFAMATTPNVPAVQSDVLRLAGLDRYETAAEIAQQGWTNSEFAVLSAGMDENLVDALTAAPLAKAKNAPILLTEGTSLNAYAEDELLRLGVKTVYVTSGTGVIQQPVLDKLISLGIAVKPLGGNDRFETALNIAKELPKFNELIMTTAWTNADALSVASIAAAKGVPILLTDVQSMPSSVSTYVNSVKTQVAKTYVLGGTGVVSDSVESSLPSPERLGGLDRYTTNQEILEAFASDLKPGQIFIANGQDNHLVDSLAASPLAAQSKSPVILIDGILTDTTKNFVKLNLLTNNVVALGGESVVGSEVSSLTTATVYSEDGAVKGSSDAAQPEVVQEVLKITGKDVSVKNVKADYSIYVKGDNVTLDNVTVTGTIFVDPGETGTATLSGVAANKIVVLSGAKDSIHIVNSKAGTLLVSSDTQTRVEASGTTKIGNTVVTSYAILDANGGSLGQVLIATEPGKDAVVELRGTFTEPIVVTGQASLKAAANAVVNTVVIATQDAEQKVTLDGAFKKVVVTTEAKVDLAANTTVELMETLAKATIIVPPSAKIDKLDAGTTGTLVGGGGTVNNQTTPITPAVLPPTSTTPSTGGSTGGGGSSVEAPSVNWISADATDSVTRKVNNPGPYIFSFDNVSDSVKVEGLTVSTDASQASLTITSIYGRGMEWIQEGKTISSTLPSDGIVKIGDLLGNLDTNGDGISLSNLRLVFGNGDTLVKGYLAKNGKNSSEITVTLRLGSPVGEPVTRIENEYVIVQKDSQPKHATVTIKSGQDDVTLGEMNSTDFDFAQLVIAVANPDSVTGGNTTDVAELRTAIQNLISGNILDLITLGDLREKTITFGSYVIKFVGEDTI